MCHVSVVRQGGLRKWPSLLLKQDGRQSALAENPGFKIEQVKLSRRNSPLAVTTVLLIQTQLWFCWTKIVNKTQYSSYYIRALKNSAWLSGSLPEYPQRKVMYIAERINGNANFTPLRAPIFERRSNIPGVSCCSSRTSSGCRCCERPVLSLP